MVNGHRDHRWPGHPGDISSREDIAKEETTTMRYITPELQELGYHCWFSISYNERTFTKITRLFHLLLIWDKWWSIYRLLKLKTSLYMTKHDAYKHKSQSDSGVALSWPISSYERDTNCSSTNIESNGWRSYNDAQHVNKKLPSWE